MSEFSRLEEAENLIVKYYEISKIRDQVERIRQFVEIDILLRDYAELVRKRIGVPKLRLSFEQQRKGRPLLRVHTFHHISPIPSQEKALVEFSTLLTKTMSYETTFQEPGDGSELI